MAWGNNGGWGAKEEEEGRRIYILTAPGSWPSGTMPLFLISYNRRRRSRTANHRSVKLLSSIKTYPTRKSRARRHWSVLIHYSFLRHNHLIEFFFFYIMWSSELWPLTTRIIALETDLVESVGDIGSISQSCKRWEGLSVCCVLFHFTSS